MGYREREKSKNLYSKKEERKNKVAMPSQKGS